MLYILEKPGRQILKQDWRALAIRYTNGAIRFMFGLDVNTEKKIKKIFNMINGDITSPKTLINWRQCSYD